MFSIISTIVATVVLSTLPLFGFSADYSTKTLQDDHQKSFLDASTKNKHHVYSQSFDAHPDLEQQITVFSQPNLSSLPLTELQSAVRACKLPMHFRTSRTKRFFTYEHHVPKKKQTLLVTLNFADPVLFKFCKSDLFGQDEVQVAQHPHLGLLAQEVASSTPALLDGTSNSILVHNVPQLCTIDTQKIIDGQVLYGSNFAQATPAQIDERLTIVEPHKNNSILAIAATNVCGRRVYTKMMIEDFLGRILSGFKHAQSISTQLGLGKIIIHSGGLGTGAFGHSKVASIVMQLIAAQVVSRSMKAPQHFEIRFFGTSENTYRKALDIFKEFRSQVKKAQVDFSNETVAQATENTIFGTLSTLFNEHSIFPHNGTGD
jgi:hypothetical protein